MSRQRAFVILVWLLLLALASWRLGTATRFDSDMSLFLPSASSLSEQLAVEQLRDGPGSRLILVGLRGDDPRVLATLSRAMVGRLRALPAFLRVENGAFARQQGDPKAFRYRYLLAAGLGAGVCSIDFDPAQLRRELQARLDELRSPLPMLDREHLRSDPTACFRGLLQAWRPAQQPRRAEGVWFATDGRDALLLIETRAAATNLALQEQAVAAIRRAFAASVDELPTADRDARLLLAGPAVFAVSSKQTIQGEITWLSTAASVVVMLVLLFVFRSPTFLVLGMLPLLTGVLSGALAVSLVYGSIHGITVAFGVTLLGVAIDYPIHAFAHARSTGGLANGVRRIWRTLVLGLLTTVGGYLALVSPEFPGLTQLALFAAGGLVAAALATRWLLPALAPTLAPPLHWTPGPRRPRPISRPVSRLAGVTRRRWWSRLRVALPVAAALLALSPLLTGYPPLQDDLAALSPIPAARLALDRELRRGLGAPEVGTLLLITGADAEAVLQRAEALDPVLTDLRKQGVIAGFDLASRLLPSQATQARQQQSLPGDAALRRRLRRALDGLPFKPDGFDPFLAAIQDSRGLVPLTPSDLSGSLLSLRLSPLLYQRADGWVALAPLYQVSDVAALRGAIDASALDGVYLLDIRRTSNAIVHRFLEETLAKLCIGGLLMLLFLMVMLRDARRWVAVVLPVSLAIALDLTLLSWFEPKLNLFHLVALLLVAGLAVDYSLFFSRRPTGSRRERADESAETRRAVSLCALSTFLMFVILAGSSLPVLHAIGVTVATGVALAYGLALLSAGVGKDDP